jgi:serine/threonine protein kinase
MIGKTISHYKILKELGRGGMSMVFQAQDEKLGRYVALKLLQPHLSADEDQKQRFIQEARAASALDHNNIGTIYEIGETDDGHLFIAMACYEGGSLKEKIRDGPLPIKAAIDIAAQIAQGLAKAHEQGIVHRDIKPANVMLTKDGVAKIVDFGLAKLTSGARLTKTGAIVGTPAYMSPEQARNIDVDHRADIWALGLVLYEMLTDRLPFYGDQEVTLLYSILKEEPEPLRKYLPQAPAQLEQIIKHALEKPLDKRYQTVNDLLADLRRGAREPAPLVVENLAPEGRQFVAEATRTLETGRHSQGIALSEEALQAAPGESLTFSDKLRFLTKLALAREESPEPPPGSNPYLNRLVIQNPKEFYGRSSELTRIYERIKAVRPQSTSLVGVRRIGKSSLLRAIYHLDNRRQHLPNPHEYVFVFMDLQTRRNVEPAEFFQYLYSELQKEYRSSIKLNVEPDYEGLQKIVQTFQDCSLKLIFLWDEFESVTRNQKFGPQFYAYFRALANHFNVAYITSSSGQLQSLCHAKEISDSPFFNIFTNQRLSAFKPQEARQLIAEPSARAGKPLAPHANFILEIAGYFPFFIQMACASLYAADKQDYKKAREIFMEEARPHFQEYWERFDESEKAAVVALAKEKKPPREHAFAVKDLAQAGFVQEGKLFSVLFAEFVREVARKDRPWWQVW